MDSSQDTPIIVVGTENLKYLKILSLNVLNLSFKKQNLNK